MTAKRYFYMLTGILVLLIGLIIGGTVGGNMLLQKQSKKLTALKVDTKTVELQQTALIQAKKDVEKYSELEKIAKSVVPQDKDQAKTVREIVQIASANGIPIKSVTFQSSNLGDAAAAAAKTTESSTTAPKAANPGVSQVKPVDGIPGVYTLEIQVASAGEVSYQNFLKFLESMEKNRRTAHVSAISLDPSDDGKRLNFNLTVNAYVKP
jgi:Tfp pilus assembly protein PilO